MRTKLTFINTIASVVQSIMPFLLQFLSRTVFIATLGVSYLGLNSIFNDLFTMLSLMELGIGSAMTFFLYEPLANDDIDRIKKLMKLYEQLYRLIGISMGFVGICLIPFLDSIVNTETPIENLTVFYLLMLLNLVVSYLFTYKRSIFTADQKNYINSVNDLIFLLLRHIFQIAILLITKNYLAYLIIAIIITISSNISISIRADKQYPYLREKVIDKLPISDIKHIFSRVSALFAHKLGSVVAFGTDNLMMSVFGSIKFVGLYANYTLIINAINLVIMSLFNNMTASLGNLSISADSSKVYLVFKRANFINYILIGFSSICMFFLFNPFISLWLGEDFTLSQVTIWIIVVNFYLSGMRQVALSFSNAKGYFWETRYKPIFEAGIDLLFSILLGYFYGPLGILIASTISFVATVWVEPFVLYKKWFNVPARIYFIDYAKKILLTLFIGYLVYLSLNIIPNSENNIFVHFVLVISLTLFLLVVVFLKNEEFKYYLNLATKLLKKDDLRNLKD
ncbi:hypothetical protein FPV21_01890 [Carnobacterium sp. PL12RED10]|uniref:lipopolysaccharide biosynthesis protein n=1 Tax=Carnobacterium sp. PL12RED10 TaxID=2592351 RepID=UPI0011F02C56|nr:hypothetical protein [Carnobacterium sp. PL12RED10]KAF3302257.1 hypothetical protein FPV21_01890 [Carnobacterium sp. PL12RED10]